MKKWHSYPQSCVRLQSHAASSPLQPETVPVPILLVLHLPVHVLCPALHKQCEPLGSVNRETPSYWWEEKLSSVLQHWSYANRFRQELGHLSPASQCHIQGFYFLLHSSLGPGSAKVQPAAAPFFHYWWGLGFIFYIQLRRCARHFTQIYKDKALKSLYRPNKSQHS